MELLEVSRVPQRLNSRVWWQFKVLGLMVHRFAIWDELYSAGGKRYDYGVLAALEQFGPSSQADLTRSIGIDRSDMVESLNSLERRGYVVRTQDPADRRRNLVDITPKGRDWIVQLDSIYDRAQEQVLAPLNEQEREQLNVLLNRVMEHHLFRSKSGEEPPADW